ncbi:hypothetical protein D3C86_2108620 [compost metagenome]
MAVGDRYFTQLLNNTRHIGQGEEVIDGRAQYAQRRVRQLLHRNRRQQALQVLERRVLPLQPIELLVQGA